MKILHVAETIKGGVATVIEQLSDGVSSKPDFEIRCLVPRSQVNELKRLPEQTLVGFSDRGRGVRTNAMLAIRLIGTMLRYRPDILHLHSSFAGFIGRVCALALRPVLKTKVVYCPHAFSFMMTGPRWKLRLYALVERVLYNLTDAIICVSRHEYEQGISHGLPAARMRVIYNGTAAPPESISSKSTNKSDSKLQLLFVGRLDFQKGFDVLEEAMRRVKRADVQLTVIGSAVYGTETKSTDPRISYLGWTPRSELAKYFHSADALVIPSRWEGFAMVPIEAMSHGTALISSNFPSLEEAVIDGVNGWTFPVEDRSALASIIERITKEECKVKGEAGRIIYELKFRAETMCSETIELYRSI